MSLALKVALGPLLLAQGLYVRWRTPLLPEPRGERIGTTGEGPLLRLLVLGDSAAAGVGVEEQKDALLGQLVHHLAIRHRVEWQLIARTGATTRSTHEHLATLEPFKADVVVLSLGVNDITSGVSQAEFLEQQNALFGLLQERFAIRHIVVSGMPPVHRFPALPQPLRWYLGRVARSYDKALRERVSGRAGCHSLLQPAEGPLSMMSSDGFHPGAPVYARWAKLAADLIHELVRMDDASSFD